MTSAKLTWHSSLTEDQQHAIRELVAVATATDDVAPVGEQVLNALALASEEHPPHVVATDEAGVLVGYAQLTQSTVELVVSPEARGQGIGTELAAEAIARAGESVRVWAHGDLDPARVLAAKLGLVPRRELLQLRRSLAEPLPELVVDSSVLLRDYDGPVDDAEILRVNNAAFSWHPEQGGWTRADIDERRAAPWFDPQGLFLAYDAVRQSHLLGFHWTKVHLDEPGLGEVYIVGVDPAAQGRGIGRLLTLAGLHHLQRRELTEVSLYVEGGNHAALHTYQGLGFTRFAVDVAYGRPAQA